MSYLIKIDWNWDDLFIMNVETFNNNTKLVEDSLYKIDNTNLLGKILSDNDNINVIGIRTIILEPEQMWW